MNTILSSVIIAGMPPGKKETRVPLSADVKVHVVQVEANDSKWLLAGFLSKDFLGEKLK